MALAEVPAPTLGPSQSQLEYLASQTASSLLRPYMFFVGWQGVLTLAFSGFPPSLASLKASINDSVVGLPPEYAGSKWPKASLGALRDRARLTPEQLQRLNAICREASAPFGDAADGQAVLVDGLNAVFYECRSLERRILQTRMALSPQLDARPPEAGEQQRVAALVAEGDDPGYWFHASKDGNREAHYRSSALGLTLVHDLACFGAAGAAQPQPHRYGSDLPGLVRAFRARVEAELPGLYTFFGEGSLHITLRSLLG